MILTPPPRAIALKFDSTRRILCRLCAGLSILGSIWLLPEAEAQQWNTNASGNWGDTANWTPAAVPNAAGTIADVRFNISASRIVTLDIDPTIGTLILGDTNASTNVVFVIGAAPGSGTLTFDNLGAGAFFNHNSATTGLNPAGNDRIDANVTIADALGLTIDSDKNLEFRGAWDGGGNDLTLTNTNAGSRLNDPRFYWNASGTNLGVLSNVDTLNILYGEARFDGIAGTANSQLIGATSINLGNGTLQSDSDVFPRLFLVNTETTQTATLNVNGGWLVSDLGSIDNLDIWGGAINFTGAATTNIFDVNDAGAADTHIVSGTIGGMGGFSKVNSGTLELTAANGISGEIYIQRGGVGGTSISSEGGVRLSGAIGALGSVDGITISRDGSLYLDNSVSVNSDRFNDAGFLNLRGSGRLRMIGNSAAPASENFGTLNQESGSGKVNFDLDDTTPQLTSLTFSNYLRSAGSITQFQVIENTPGAFGSQLGGNARLFITDLGASADLYGGGGADLSTNKTIVVGAFGGVNNISNHFMTFDGDFATELRPLTWDGTVLGSEYFLSRDSLAVPHQFTRAGLGSVDQNVNLNYNVTLDGDVGTGLPGSGSDYGWYGKAPIAILENVAMNSLRFGTNTPTSTTNASNTNEIGSALVLAPGAHLYLGDKAADAELPAITTSGSGMILFGRDVDGTSPGSNQYISGGVLEFGSREAILVNESGNSAFFRSDIRGGGGLTKAGSSTIYFDNSNSYSGTTAIAEGLLVLRDQNGLGASNLVNIEGSGGLYLELGTNVVNSTAGPAPPDLYVGSIDSSHTVLYSNGGNNTWGGDVIIDTLDNLGNWVFTPRIGTNARDILNIDGDIYGNELLNPINTDVVLNDARLVSTVGTNSAGGIININGRFRDNSGGALNQTVTVDNENQLLRFQIAGSNELVVNVRQQWDSAGRILLEQGILRYEGDGDFFTAGAAFTDTANSQSGLDMSGSAGSSTNNNNSTFNTAFILTKPGQVLNIGRIDIGGDGTNNFNALGNVTLAGTNSGGTVTFGNGTERVVYNGSSLANAHVRDLSAYQAEGGIMELNFRLDDTDTDVHTSFTKIGRGVVNYNGQTGTADGDVEQLNMSGGLLRLTNYGSAQGRRFDNGAMIVFAGGGIEMDGVGSVANETANYTGTAAISPPAPTARTLIAPGGTDVIVTSTSGRTTTMNIGSGTIPLDRLSGGTLNLVENANGGTSVITLTGTGAPADGTAIAWATYGDSYLFDPVTATYTLNALDFAMTTAGSVSAFSGSTREETDDVSTWINGNDVSELLGFTGTTAALASVNSIHFDANATGTITIDAGGLTVGGGGVMVSSLVSDPNALKTITGGNLTAGADKDLILHHYGAAVTTVSSVIGDHASSSAGNALVKAGGGTLVLEGANTYSGGTFLNGGVLSISSETNLGAVPGAADPDNLYANGGTLRTTASLALDANRGFTLGGNGIGIDVAEGTLLTLNGAIVSEPNLSAGYAANPAVGRIDKLGSGTLLITGTDHSYNGLTEIREGTLQWETPLGGLATGTRNPFGSNQAFLDATIVRSGATLALHPRTVANNSNVTQTLNEWFTFEGGSILDVAPVNTAADPHDFNINLRGVLLFDSLGNAGTPDGFQNASTLAGATVINVARRTVNLNDDGGYVTGDGGITKIGAGTLAFRDNNPEWTGQLIVSEGVVDIYSAGNTLGVGTMPIILGHNLFAEQAGEAVSGNSTAQLSYRDEGGYRDVGTITQDIIVRADEGAGSQTKRIGGRYLANVDVVNYEGSLTLRDDLEFFYQDDVRDSTSTSGSNVRNDTRSIGTLTNSETVFINFNGNIIGATGNDIVTNVAQGGTSGVNIANGSITAPFDDFVIRAIFGLNGDNSGWAGNLTLGNSTSDVDREHIVSIGNALGISSANQVTMRSNATLQTSGNAVTIGNLTTPSSPSTDTFIENASTMDGSITVFQTSDAVVDLVLRDGRNFFLLQPGEADAALSFEKAGPSALTLTKGNSFSGSTTLSGGTLRLAYEADASMLSDTANLFLDDGILDLAGTVAHAEVVSGTIINGSVAITRSAGSSIIHLNTITRNAGSLRISEDNLATTDNLNVNGILGGWITVGGSFATNAGNTADGFIVGLATFDQEIDRLGGGPGTQLIANGPDDNVRIIEAGTLATPISVAAPGVTTIYTLTQGANGGPATVGLGAGNTLRIATGGILQSNGSTSLVFSPSGSLTAGASDNEAATLFLQNQDSTGLQSLVVGTGIANNGTGVVKVRTTGPGTTVFTGAHTYTGGTLVGSGTLQIGDGGNTGSLGSGGVLVEASGTLRFERSDAALSIGGMLSGEGAILQSGSGTTTLAAASPLSSLDFILGGGTLVSGVDQAINTTGDLVYGHGPGSSSLGSLDLTSGSATVGSLLVQTNSTMPNLLTIGAGESLNVNGAVTIGVDANNSATRLTASGGGSLIVNSGGANFQVGGATGGTNENLAVVDFSGLANFTADLGAGIFRIGDTNTGTTSNPSSLSLAADNTITAASIRVGDGSGGTSVHILTLGNGTNVLNADLINIGSALASVRSSGSLLFDAGDTTGSVTIRGSDGASRALINLINTTGSTGSSMTGTIDFTGHTADILASTVTLGSRSANSGSATGTFSFDQGTLDILSLNIANRGGTGSGSATGTVNLGDSVAPGTPTSVIGNVVMGVNSSTNASSMVTADLNVSGGIVTIGTGSGTAIDMANASTGRTVTSTIDLTGGTVTLLGDIRRSGNDGTENTTITLDGAVLDLSNHEIGSGAAPITLVASSGTLANLGELNGGGAFAKTSTGVLILEGSNGFTGDTAVTEGTLQLGSGGMTGSMHLDSDITVSMGAVFSVNQSDEVSQGIDFSGAAIGGDGSFAQIGDGTTRLTAANSYTGGTAVSDGILLVNNTSGSGTGSGPVTVTGDAILGGTGTIGGNTYLAPGTSLAAGDPLVGGEGGTLAFSGNLESSENSFWLVDLVRDMNGVSDLIEVANGSLSLNSATLSLITTGAFTEFNSYTIATYNTLSGTFDGLAEGAIISNYQISYGLVTPGAITLTAVPEPGTLGILGVALGGFYLRRRRRRLKPQVGGSK